MDKLRVYYDRAGNTLSVWFDDPKKDHICEESARRGRVIGFERLNFLTASSVKIPVELEMG